jgi:hypothetical protein
VPPSRHDNPLNIHVQVPPVTLRCVRVREFRSSKEVAEVAILQQQKDAGLNVGRQSRLREVVERSVCAFRTIVSDKNLHSSSPGAS